MTTLMVCGDIGGYCGWATKGEQQPRQQKASNRLGNKRRATGPATKAATSMATKAGNCYGG
jgi:hypothetical protein